MFLRLQAHPQPLQAAVVRWVLAWLFADQEYHGPPHDSHDDLHSRGYLDRPATLVDYPLPGGLHLRASNDGRGGVSTLMAEIFRGAVGFPWMNILVPMYRITDTSGNSGECRRASSLASGASVTHTHPTCAFTTTGAGGSKGVGSQLEPC